jgi:hypothetical protein
MVEINSLNNDQLDEVKVDKTRLLIENVLESCSDEMIQLYVFLIFNSNLDDNFKIEEIRRNRSRVMVKFNQEFDFESMNVKHKKLPELNGNEINFRKVNVPDTIRVSELANNCSKEILSLYFTNQKVSNGGDVKSIKYYSFENTALVQFKNLETVDHVLERAHIICETTVKCAKYYGPIEDEYIREEEELNSSVSYLEDTKKDLLESSKQKEKKKTLAALATLKSFSIAPTQIDRTRMLVSNIPENINIQQLEFYIKLVTNKLEIDDINWSLDFKGKIMIDFKKEIDIGKILHEFNNNSLNNLNGKAIQLETLQTTRTLVVLVKDVKSKRPEFKLETEKDEDYKPETIPATRDLLDLYFSNKQRSGGGEVESIERKSSRYWLVVMKDQRSVKNILSRKHIIDEKPIKMFPYFENFGLPYLFKPIFDDLNTSSSTAFNLKVKDERLRYFCKVKNSHKKLNEILAESNAVSRYNKQESNILYVSYVERLQTKVPYIEKIWRLRVKECIEYFLQIYKYEKLTLSFNQWATLSKTKQINENLFNRENNNKNATYEEDEDGNQYDESNVIYDANDVLNDKSGIKYVGNNCAILSINETPNNVEMHVVGPNLDVDRFINKIKDIVCEAFFTFELEEKIIKFKTYLYECEGLLTKWLGRSEPEHEDDSDAEVTLASARSGDSDSQISFTKRNDVKLNKSRRNTIGQFITKLERDHLDMELSYGKLFQELGYTFLSHASQEPTEEDDDEYREANERFSSTLNNLNVAFKQDSSQSQMDKIKQTLDDLRLRISDMRRKFRQYDIKFRRQNKSPALSEVSGEEDIDENLQEYEDGDENDGLFKLFVYATNLEKLVTFKVHRKCTIKELKEILFEKIADPKEHHLDDMVLKYNNIELANDLFTVSDYAISEKANIFLEFDS